MILFFVWLTSDWLSCFRFQSKHDSIHFHDDDNCNLRTEFVRPLTHFGSKGNFNVEIEKETCALCQDLTERTLLDSSVIQTATIVLTAVKGFLNSSTHLTSSDLCFEQRTCPLLHNSSEPVDALSKMHTAISHWFILLMESWPRKCFDYFISCHPILWNILPHMWEEIHFHFKAESTLLSHVVWSCRPEVVKISCYKIFVSFLLKFFPKLTKLSHVYKW